MMFTFTSRRDRLVGLLAVAALLVLATGVQVARDRRFSTDKPAEQQLLYVQSPAVMKRLTLAYAGLAADVYWIRAIQYFGSIRHSDDPNKSYALLYPLLNIATTLDPRFNLMDGLDIYVGDYTKSDPIPDDVLKRLVQARAIFNPPKTMVTAEGHVVDVPPETEAAPPEVPPAAVEHPAPEPIPITTINPPVAADPGKTGEKP